MENPVALMASIMLALCAVVFAVKREDTPWYLATVAFGLLALLFLNNAVGTPTLSELTGECK